MILEDWYMMHFSKISVVSMIISIVTYIWSIKASKCSLGKEQINYNTLVMIGIAIASWVPIIQLIIFAVCAIIVTVFSIRSLNSLLSSFDSRINSCLKCEKHN